MDEHYMSYLWQEVKGDKWWRIQTNDPAIIRKLRRRDTTSITVYCYNDPMMVFRTQYYKPEKAKQSFERLTSQKIEKDSVNGLLVAKTAPILHQNDKGEVSK